MVSRGASGPAMATAGSPAESSRKNVATETVMATSKAIKPAFQRV